MTGDGVSDATIMLIWAESHGWQRFQCGQVNGHRKFTGHRWVWASGEDIGQVMLDNPPEFLATYFRGIEITHRSWMN